jgi:RNA polymerase sigma-70 factor, ECF subfamily
VDGERRAEQDWAALMARSQAGDQHAYRCLLESIAPYLRALARRAGLTPDEIEDGVQDVLLTLHTIRHTYDPARPFAPWLVAIARHRLVDRMRRRSRRAARETALTEAHETLPAAEANYHETASNVRRLRGAIADLPAGQRQAVELLRLQELSLKEASTASGQSPTALKVAVHRAVRRLRGLLAKE